MGKRKAKGFTGRVFRIERDGNRVKIFLKGCPLSCLWCPNPEGISPEREPVWSEEKCTGCHACVQSAVAGGVRAQDDRILLSSQASEPWDSIIAQCPTGALRWNSEDVDAEQIMEKLQEDLPNIQSDDGGIIITGGDPLMQGPFVRELLEACREQHIRTSMVTELFGPWEVIDALMADLDALYVDIKLLESDQAKRYTSKGTMLIKDNFRRLMESKHKDKIRVWTTLIPGITATEGNISSIAQYLAGYDPEIPYILVNYDSSTPRKYSALRRKYFNEEMEPLSSDQMEVFANIARANGLANVRIAEECSAPD